MKQILPYFIIFLCTQGMSQRESLPKHTDFPQEKWSKMSVRWTERSYPTQLITNYGDTVKGQILFFEDTVLYFLHDNGLYNRYTDRKKIEVYHWSQFQSACITNNFFNLKGFLWGLGCGTLVGGGVGWCCYSYGVNLSLINSNQIQCIVIPVLLFGPVIGELKLKGKIETKCFDILADYGHFKVFALDANRYGMLTEDIPDTLKEALISGTGETSSGMVTGDHWPDVNLLLRYSPHFSRVFPEKKFGISLIGGFTFTGYHLDYDRFHHNLQIPHALDAVYNFRQRYAATISYWYSLNWNYSIESWKNRPEYTEGQYTWIENSRRTFSILFDYKLLRADRFLINRHQVSLMAGAGMVFMNLYSNYSLYLYSPSDELLGSYGNKFKNSQILAGYLARFDYDYFLIPGLSLKVRVEGLYIDGVNSPRYEITDPAFDLVSTFESRSVRLSSINLMAGINFHF